MELIREVGGCGMKSMPLVLHGWIAKEACLLPGDYRALRIFLAHNGRQSTAPRNGHGSFMSRALPLPSTTTRPRTPNVAVYFRSRPLY